MMRVVGLEEHLATPEVITAWQRLDPQWQDLALAPSSAGESGRRLLELGDDRIAAMDAAGIDVQVLSLTSPGVQNLAPVDAVALQREVNDVIVDALHRHPDRFRGLATLATPDPDAAAQELQRAIGLGLDGAMLFGRTREHNLDDERYRPIFEAAAALRAPLYIHPQSPVPEVRVQYYSGLAARIDPAFATHGLGWHYETGIQLLRLILSGVFDRFPDLQVVTGHWGEVILFYLERIAPVAAAAGLERPLADYFTNNVYVTPSGMLSARYLRWALEILGPERIMFSTDYPFVSVPAAAASDLLAATHLAKPEQELIASENWERLCAPISR